MVLLLTLLLAAPAFAQPADCRAVPVGPPMNVDIYVGLPNRTTAPVPRPIVGGIGLTQLPSRGTRCPAPPPPRGDVLRGTTEPRDLLRGDAKGDILSGAPSRADPPRP
jgi:hypothetical protein